MLSSRQVSILLSIVLLLFQSCSIEKRRYTSGYHITRNGQKQDVVHEPKAESLAPSKHPNSSIETAEQSTVKTEPAAIAQQIPTAKDSLEKNVVPSATRKQDKNPVFTKRNEVKGVLRKTWISEIASSPDAVSNADEQEKSILAYLTIFITLLAILTLLIASFIATGWAALGYFILSIMIAVPACILGMVALLTAKKNNRRIPIAFYPFFILSCIATLGLLVLLITK